VRHAIAIRLISLCELRCELASIKDKTTKDTDIVNVPGACVNLRKSEAGKKKRISDVKKKAMQRKATSTFHSRLNFSGDEHVTKNTIIPKSKSVLHDFATDGKDDHD
jgi:hypothetical protein